VQTVSSSVTSAEAAQLKRKAKGKNTGGYDPKKPKKLTIFVALSYPAWQEKYIDLVREAFDGVSINDKELNPKVSKLGEMKKAMPFVQILKKRLTTESPEAVFNRKLAFDEVEALKHILPTLKKNTGCKEIDIVVVDEGGKTGKKVNEEGETKVEGLSVIAEGAEPGNPKFEFANIE
jgi:leucyl-tRNA synthetase